MLRNVCQSLQQRVPYFMKLYPGRAALCTVLSIFLQLVEVVSLHTSQRECFMSFFFFFFFPSHHLHRFYTGHHLGFLKGYKNRLCILHKQLKRTSASRHVWVKKCRQINSPYFPVPSFPLKSMGVAVGVGGLDWKAE